MRTKFCRSRSLFARRGCDDGIARCGLAPSPPGERTRAASPPAPEGARLRAPNLACLRTHYETPRICEY